MLAANLGKLEIVRYLMSEGEDMNFKDNVRVYDQIDVTYDGITCYLVISLYRYLAISFTNARTIRIMKVLI